MKINTVGIIGGTNGLGARMADYFKATFPNLEVQVAGRNTKLSSAALVAASDLVIFAVPIDQTVTVIKSMVPHARPEQIWADFTSVKQQPVAAMEESVAQVCGLHPLFGPIPEIEGQTMIYCPTRIAAAALDSLLELLQGFNLMEFTPPQHDDLMGVVQCASHFSELVMGEAVRRSGFDFETIWQVSSPSYRLKLEVMGRMFAQSPDLYADIATQNLSAARFTQIFQQATNDLADAVEQHQREAFIESFAATRQHLTPEFCAQAYAASQNFLAAYGAQAVSENATEVRADIAIFGEVASHTDSASADFSALTGNGTKTYFKNIFRLVDAVNRDQVQWGIVPYENTTEGSVLEVLDELLDHPEVQVVAATERSIEQYLMARPGTTANDIERVFSHPQALAQSKAYLRSNLSTAELVPAASTASAARRVKQGQSRSWAAVGSKNLARQLGLEIVSPNMAERSNRTRFVCVAKHKVAPVSKVTSMVFWFSADQSGNLAQVLNYFSEQNINLLKLDSRRASADKGGFVFFVDAEISWPDFKAHQVKLSDIVAGLQVLGSY